jgi:hypothetical protein
LGQIYAGEGFRLCKLQPSVIRTLIASTVSVKPQNKHVLSLKKARHNRKEFGVRARRK